MYSILWASFTRLAEEIGHSYNVHVRVAITNNGQLAKKYYSTYMYSGTLRTGSAFPPTHNFCARV